VDHKGYMRVQNPDTVEEWLRIWGQWILGRIGPDVPRCISLESQWRSPQCWDAPEPPKKPQPDWIGYRVEIAIKSLPEPFRRAVRVEYSFVRQPGQTDAGFYDAKRRCAQLPAWQYHTVVDKALGMLELALGIVDNSVGVGASHENAQV
jgi:hypothetical protein